MQNKTLSQLGRLSGLGLLISSLGLAGCGVHMADTTAPIAAAGVAFHGSVHGGQQPVAGATIQLYAPSTAGYGAASYALLTTAATSDANGNFNISGQYTCPSATTQVYLTATGGNPGAGANANLAMLTSLGQCGNLTPTTFVSINELTTVASVYALAPFMTGIANVGTSATNAVGLNNAFAAAGKIANQNTGQLPGTLPANAVAPAAEINTLADILAACINSTGGVASNTTTTCGKLFSYTTPASGVAPTDTVMAALNIAKFPSRNTPQLTALVTSTAPFQPTLTAAPSDYTISIKYFAGLSGPVTTAIDAAGNIWIPDPVSTQLTVLANSGFPVAGSPFSGNGMNNPVAVAIDGTGAAIVVNRNNSSLSKFTTAGGAGFVSGGLNLPQGIAIDGSGLLWITNGGNNTLTRYAGDFSSNTVFTGGGLNNPVAVAINPF